MTSQLDKIGLLELREFKTYGTMNEGVELVKKKKKKYDPDEAEYKVGLLSLFRFANKTDTTILFIGILSSIVHGASFPALALVFGQMTNAFIVHANVGKNISLEGRKSDLHSLPNENGDLVQPFLSIIAFESFATISSNENEEFSSYLANYSLNYLYIGAVVLIAAFVQTLCWETACERQIHRLRQVAFTQILRQDISWYDTRKCTNLANALSDDAERIREGIGCKFSMVTQYVSTFITGTIVGAVVNWKLTGLLLLIAPILIGASAFLAKLTASSAAREQLKYGQAGMVAEEVLTHVHTVAAFSTEQSEVRRYEKALEAGRQLAMKKYLVLAWGLTVVFFLMYAQYAAAFYYGAILIDEGYCSPGSVFTVFFSVLSGAFTLGNALPYVNSVATAFGAAHTMFRIVDRVPRLDPYSDVGIIPSTFRGHIQFRNVHFSYPSRPYTMILNNLNLEIKPRKTVAFVGPSGSGKSTIVNLLLRLYEPSHGEIRLDGRPLQELNVSWLRSKYGVVSQEPVLFGVSIADNIRYGNFTASQDDIEIAATMANAHGFIDELPEGYETVLGERGAQLSGGQKQRVALARALLREPAVLLLDEATSALDAESEGVVQEALERAMLGRTTIIVAHRLSTIRNADVIFVLDNGRVVEQGRHADLMSKHGLYFRLVNTQEIFQPNEWELYHRSMDFGSPYDFEMEPEPLMRQRLSMDGVEPYQLHKEAYPDPKGRKVGLCQLLRLNSPECSSLLAGLLGCCVGGAIMPVFAFFYGEVFATFTKEGQELLDAAIVWSLMFVVLGVLAGIGIWFEVAAMTDAVEKLVMRLRVMAFRNILRQPVGWFDMKGHSSGNLITRLARDAPLIKGAAGLRLGQLLASMVTLVVALSIAFYFGWQLALLLLLVVPLITAGAYHQTRMMRRTQLRDARFMDDAGRLASESIQNIKTVQTLCLETLFVRLYTGMLILPFREAKKQAVRYSVVFALSQAVIYMMYAGAFRFGAYLILHGIMNSSDIYRVFFALAFCAASVGTSSAYVQDYTKAKMAAQQLFLLIDRKSEIDPLSPDGLRPEIKGKVNFHEVCFHYPSRPDVKVLRGVTLTVAAGQTLAVVGQSGCGKSTLMTLLERFYQPTEGLITLDGIDIGKINVHHLRRHIGLVTQEPMLFNKSIKDNIAYGLEDNASPGTTRLDHGSADFVLTKVIEAAVKANCHTFISQLPQGYETRVGDRGCQLSGGQKQRIAIARALVRDPRILLLDEATSALDAENEKLVQEALEKAREGRTCIVIAHRLTTIQNADIIAVLDSGKIREMGSHLELQELQGLYYRLMNAQRI